MNSASMDLVGLGQWTQTLKSNQFIIGLFSATPTHTHKVALACSRIADSMLQIDDMPLQLRIFAV